MDDSKQASRKGCPKKDYLFRHSTDSNPCSAGNWDEGESPVTEASNGQPSSSGGGPAKQRTQNRMDSISQMSLPEDLHISFLELEEANSIQLGDIDLTYSSSGDVDLNSTTLSALEPGKDDDSHLRNINAAISSTSGSNLHKMISASKHSETNSGSTIDSRNPRPNLYNMVSSDVKTEDLSDSIFEDGSWKDVANDQQVSTVGSSGQGLQKKKLHSAKRSSKNKHLSNMVCQVCGDMAAGFYCGAYICEACKKFYMRAYKQDKLKYVCLRDKKCVITKESRVQCQYCRFQKCVQLNMYCPKQGEAENGKEMHMSEIPCRVCSAPSSGFHFGAITCEGCKGFFRRMAKEREAEKYQCNKSGVCEINMITRNLCKACRYRACLKAGMCVEGSRIGRQPNSVKHAISIELKSQGKDGPTGGQYPFEPGMGLTKVKDEPVDTESTYQDDNKSNDPYNWNNQWSSDYAADTHARTSGKMSDDQFLSTVSATMKGSGSRDGTSHVPSHNQSAVCSSPMTTVPRPTMGSSSPSWASSSYNPKPVSQPGPVRNDSMSSIKSSHIAVNNWLDSMPFDTAGRTVNSSNAHSNEYQNREENWKDAAEFHRSSSVGSMSGRPTVKEEACDYHSKNNSSNTQMPFGNSSQTASFSRENPMPEYNARKRSAGSFSDMNLWSKASSDETSATPLNTLPGHTLGHSNYMPTSKGSNPSVNQSWSVPQSPNNVRTAEGGMKGPDPQMNEFINKILEAGKGLQLLNYRVFDTDMNPTTTMNVDDIKALFKSNYMDPKAGNQIRSKVDMSIFSTRESTWNYMMTNFHNNTYITIRFAKLVPGFKSLSLNDQVKLIQSSIYPIELLNMSKVFDPDTKKYNYFTYTKEEEDIMMDHFPMLRVFQEHFLHIGEMVTEFKFTDEEFAMLSALVLFPSEIHGLEDPKAVETLQTELSAALHYYEEVTFPDGLMRYGILLVRVAELVQCLLQHNLAIGLLLTQNPTIKVPQLFHELIIESIKEGQK